MTSPPPALDRTRPPRPGVAAPFRFPFFEHFELSNGLRIFLYRNPVVPTVELTLTAPLAGGDAAPLEFPGLSALTASLLDEGTTRRSGSEIAQAVEQLGGSLSTSADWNAARIDIEMLAADLPIALEILQEIATEPTFPEAQVQRLVRQALAELARRQDRPSALADDLITEELFPGTALAFPLLGTPESLKRIGREETLRFFEHRFGPASSALLVGGDFDPANLAKEILKHFSAWQKPLDPPVCPVEAQKLSARKIIVLDRPHNPQTELRVAHGAPRRVDPRWAQMTLLSSILGGKFMSRLNLNLRERHGFTYGASSRFAEWRSAGLLVIATAVANEVAAAAAQEILTELDRLRSELVPEEELHEAKDYLSGVFPFKIRTTGGVLSRLEEIALFNLPLDSHDRWLEELRATTSQQLRELARLVLDPEHALLVAVGPAVKIASGLELLGAVEVRQLPG